MYGVTLRHVGPVEWTEDVCMGSCVGPVECTEDLSVWSHVKMCWASRMD